MAEEDLPLAAALVGAPTRSLFTPSSTVSRTERSATG